MFASTRRVSCGLPVGKCVCVCVKECVSGGRKCRLHADSEGHSHSCLLSNFFFGRDGWPPVPPPLCVCVGYAYECKNGCVLVCILTVCVHRYMLVSMYMGVNVCLIDR